jgi:hypothetical protein
MVPNFLYFPVPLQGNQDLRGVERHKMLCNNV